MPPDVTAALEPTSEAGQDRLVSKRKQEQTKQVRTIAKEPQSSAKSQEITPSVMADMSSAYVDPTPSTVASAIAGKRSTADGVESTVGVTATEQALNAAMAKEWVMVNVPRLSELSKLDDLLLNRPQPAVNVAAFEADKGAVAPVVGEAITARDENSAGLTPVVPLAALTPTPRSEPAVAKDSSATYVCRPVEAVGGDISAGKQSSP